MRSASCPWIDMYKGSLCMCSDSRLVRHDIQLLVIVKKNAVQPCGTSARGMMVIGRNFQVMVSHEV
jgi:hypothetical protein